MSKDELQILESQLQARGYRKYNEAHSKGSAWQWYKGFISELDEYGDSSSAYQAAVYVYDWRPFIDRSPELATNPFSVCYECLFGEKIAKGRLDITCSSDDMDILKWEARCERFYQLLKSQP